MLTMSPFCPTVGLSNNYPLELGTDQAFEDFIDLDSIFPSLINSPPHQFEANHYDQEYANHDYVINHDYVNKQSESPQGTSSTNYHFDDNNPMLTKKLSHNASERNRRKKINDMYASLRALLPGIDHKKKLSIPRTVARVLEYIPELQKEVEDLNHKKEVIVSKIRALQGYANNQDDETPKRSVTKETSLCFISSNKISDKEMVIQISTLDVISSICAVLLLLEKNGYLVLDVSSYQSFGGRTFYNIHLWTNGSNNVNLEKLNQVLQLLLEK